MTKDLLSSSEGPRPFYNFHWQTNWWSRHKKSITELIFQRRFRGQKICHEKDRIMHTRARRQRKHRDAHAYKCAHTMAQVRRAWRDRTSLINEHLQPSTISRWFMKQAENTRSLPLITQRSQCCFQIDEVSVVVSSHWSVIAWRQRQISPADVSRTSGGMPAILTYTAPSHWPKPENCIHGDSNFCEGMLAISLSFPCAGNLVCNVVL